MSDAAEKLARASEEHIAARWTEARVQRIAAKMRPARRTIAPRAFALAAAACALVLWWSVRAPRATDPAPPTTLVLADGTRVRPHDSQTIVREAERDARHTTLRLERGEAEFDVVHDDSRVFRVEAGALAIHVLGTRFTVQRLSERVRVRVHDGRVRVLYASGSRDLAAGQEGSFDEGSHGPPALVASADPASVTAEQREESTQNSPASRDRELAAASARPAPRVHQARSHEARVSVDESMRAADSARMAGDNAAAIAHWQRVISAHPEDSRAQIAAFSMGRLLSTMARPGEAAAAFARARALGPERPLAEDALARQAEALHRAGSRAEAQRVVAQYVERYPSGRWLRVLRALTP